MTTSDPLTRDNHYVPQAYLKAWAVDGHRVWTHRLLVPAASYPTWELRPTRGIAWHRDLYTSTMSGVDSDELERWLHHEYEQPALEPLRRLRSDEPLTPAEWHHLRKYVVAMDLRTPAAFVESQQRWDRLLPGVLQSSLTRVKQKLRQAKTSGRPLAPVPDQAGAERFPVRTRLERDDATGAAVVRAEVTSGRALWHWQIRHHLTRTIRRLPAHAWTVLRPHPGSFWFTSDHPVLRLNYYGPGQFDFEGGWGNPGSEIIFPVSPTHLLYTKVGHQMPPESVLSLEQTFLFQELIARRAHRWIIAQGQPQRATWFQSREVDQERFAAEERARTEWHDRQREAETSS